MTQAEKLIWAAAWAGCGDWIYAADRVLLFRAKVQQLRKAPAAAHLGEAEKLLLEFAVDVDVDVDVDVCGRARDVERAFGEAAMRERIAQAFANMPAVAAAIREFK